MNDTTAGSAEPFVFKMPGNLKGVLPSEKLHISLREVILKFHALKCNVFFDTQVILVIEPHLKLHLFSLGHFLHKFWKEVNPSCIDDCVTPHQHT